MKRSLPYLAIILSSCLFWQMAYAHFTFSIKGGETYSEQKYLDFITELRQQFSANNPKNIEIEITDGSALSLPVLIDHANLNIVAINHWPVKDINDYVGEPQITSATIDHALQLGMRLNLATNQKAYVLKMLSFIIADATKFDMIAKPINKILNNSKAVPITWSAYDYYSRNWGRISYILAVNVNDGSLSLPIDATMNRTSSLIVGISPDLIKYYQNAGGNWSR